MIPTFDMVSLTVSVSLCDGGSLPWRDFIGFSSADKVGDHAGRPGCEDREGGLEELDDGSHALVDEYTAGCPDTATHLCA